MGRSRSGIDANDAVGTKRKYRDLVYVSQLTLKITCKKIEVYFCDLVLDVISLEIQSSVSY